MVGEHFRALVTKILAPSRHVYVVLDAEAEGVVGTTRFINPNTDGVVEISAISRHQLGVQASMPQ